jgi:hypothetical protein
MDPLSQLHDIFTEFKDTQKLETFRTTIIFADTKIMQTKIESAKRVNVAIDFKTASDMEAVILQIQQNPVFQILRGREILVDLVSFFASGKCTMLNLDSVDCVLIECERLPALCMLNTNEDRQYHGVSAFLDLKDWITSVYFNYEINRPGVVGLVAILTIFSMGAWVCVLAYKMARNR